ncbi:DNA-binding response regulator [Ammoniphilus oxalaticus]|uniref:DNA-binding response regulator n=1 Tax=Ammoniphilus oxalaticus TaxID=66863 RepID=A0A419SKQ6_9BACL|nr:response regulator transcription factor [Ammoniphilus oxalaticus]RKD24530.1 DNA-binding response regulator [Ammoniphilus oxalaticus]
MFKIMIVEDDQKLRELIVQHLSKWEFDLFAVEAFDDVFRAFIEYKPHLVILDINLPAFNGFHWCQQIREVSKTPILFLSSRNDAMDIVMAIQMGGDDFVQKPFSFEVLVAKIQALLRRTYSYADARTDVMEYKRAILNLKDATLSYNEQKVELTKNEFKILYLLFKDSGQIVGRNTLIKGLWDEESFVDDNTLTVNVNRLRKKLGEIGLGEMIATKKGQGYLLR